MYRPINCVYLALILSIAFCLFLLTARYLDALLDCSAIENATAGQQLELRVSFDGECVMYSGREWISTDALREAIR